MLSHQSNILQNLSEKKPPFGVCASHCISDHINRMTYVHVAANTNERATTSESQEMERNSADLKVFAGTTAEPQLAGTAKDKDHTKSQGPKRFSAKRPPCISDLIALIFLFFFFFSCVLFLYAIFWVMKEPERLYIHTSSSPGFDAPYLFVSALVLPCIIRDIWVVFRS